MKKIYLLLITVILIFAVLVSAAFASETERTLTLPAAGLKALRIDCGAGRLDVSGAEGIDRIEVRAAIHAERTDASELEAFIRDHIKLSLEKRGDLAVLVSRSEEHRIFSFGRGAWIDLTVLVPKSLGLEIDDGSGSMTIQDVDGDVEISDGSGDISVGRIGGRLEIDDGSGNIDVREVAGDIAIDDGSGDLDVLKAGGGVKIDDGSGDIVIDGVAGDVLVEDAGSGGVRIENVKGRVIRHDVHDDDDDSEGDPDDDD